MACVSLSTLATQHFMITISHILLSPIRISCILLSLFLYIMPLLPASPALHARCGRTWLSFINDNCSPTPCSHFLTHFVTNPLSSQQPSAWNVIIIEPSAANRIWRWADCTSWRDTCRVLYLREILISSQIAIWAGQFWRFNQALFEGPCNLQGICYRQSGPNSDSAWHMRLHQKDDGSKLIATPGIIQLHKWVLRIQQFILNTFQAKFWFAVHTKALNLNRRCCIIPISVDVALTEEVST